MDLARITITKTYFSVALGTMKVILGRICGMGEGEYCLMCFLQNEYTSTDIFQTCHLRFIIVFTHFQMDQLTKVRLSMTTASGFLIHIDEMPTLYALIITKGNGKKIHLMVGDSSNGPMVHFTKVCLCDHRCTFQRHCIYHS